MPSWSSESPSSSPAQSIPSDMIPRNLRLPISPPPDNRPPAVTSGTRCPTARLGAPVTIVEMPSPRSTRAISKLSAFGWRSRSTTSAITTRSQSAPISTIDSASVPDIVSRCASSRGERSKSTYSRSQESGIFMTWLPAGLLLHKSRRPACFHHLTPHALLPVHLPLHPLLPDYLTPQPPFPRREGGLLPLPCEGRGPGG